MRSAKVKYENGVAGTPALVNDPQRLRFDDLCAKGLAVGYTAKGRMGVAPCRTGVCTQNRQK
jgi:hypothetical protein